MNAPSSVRRGGYEPYGSVRRGSATRWRVFARYQLEVAWQTWWRYRLALLIAVMVTATFAGLMYFLSDSSMFRGFRRLGGGELAIADGVLPASIQWYRRAAFVLSLTVTAGSISGDRESGAFALYIARSTRPVDYLAGKLVAIVGMTAILTLAGPVLLAVLRLGLFEDTSSLMSHLWLVPAMVVTGALSTLTYALVPLACSALFATRRRAISVWVGYWLLAGSVFALLGTMTSGWISAFDLASALDSVTYQLFDLHLVRRLQMPCEVAVASIALHVVAAIWIVWYRIHAAYQPGAPGS